MPTPDDYAMNSLGKLTQRQAQDLISSFKLLVETTVAKVLADQREEQVRRKVQVTDEEKEKAAEFRAQLLMGKLPEGIGLLIDVKTLASLLGISVRLITKLVAMEAIPAPVRLSRSVRWKTRQILKWVEDGCPTVQWSTSERRNYRARPKRTQAHSEAVRGIPGEDQETDA
jgi:predicted DNA-binding transcriptional regulator AlpA